jgi:hypothetical protein
MSRSISAERLRAGRARITKAFADLAKQGILAKKNFMCCMGCASSNLHREAKAAGKYMGIAYYHSQDNDRLRETGVFNVGFNSIDTLGLDEETAMLMVGHAVKLSLERHGLKVTWGGKANERLHVELPQ